MQETRSGRNLNDYEWVKCRKCGHKLFKVKQYDPMKLYNQNRESQEGDTIIEVKCHSCKEINEIIL